MVSKKSWEKFKRDVEGLNKSGVERQSWGKRTSKDLNESWSGKRSFSISEEHSFEISKKSDESDIKGFSSSDDEQSNVVCESSKSSSSLSKRTLSRTVPVTKKRRKKYDYPELKDISPIPGFQRSFSDFYRPSQTAASCKEWKNVSCNFENSFTALSSSLDLTVDSPKIVQRKEGGKENEDIIWSDSDNEHNNVVVRVGHSSKTSPPSKVPFSPMQIDVNKEAAKVKGDIDQFDSEAEEISEILSNNTTHQEPSPSISPNTPSPPSPNTEDRNASIHNITEQATSPSISPNTPTPTSPNIEEKTERPPLDSSKKKKQKYLRTGLAEKLHKLLTRQQSEKSFRSHKLRQLKESGEHDDDLSKPSEGTVTLRVLSHHVDHSVYVMTCDVVSQDVMSERELPGQVTLLLEIETRKHLDFKSNPWYLRIYPPWKIFDLPNSSTPVLLCITHCEVLPSVSLDDETTLRSKKPSAFSNTTKSDYVQSKMVPTKLFASNCTGGEYEGEYWSKWEDTTDTWNANDEPAKHTSRDVGIVSGSIMDVVGVQGQCVNDGIDFTARVQRVHWGNVRKTNQTLSCGSSLVQSIIEHSKNFKRNDSMSLCLLVQDSSGFFSEIILSSEMLLARKDWQELLSKLEGLVLTFRGLQLVEHRKRKRRPGLFGVIDLLRSNEGYTDKQGLKHPTRQTVCCTFSVDTTTKLEQFSGDEDVPLYLPPRFLTVDDLNPDAPVHYKRVSLYGKLLHTTSKKDQHYGINHVRLFISGILTGGLLASDYYEEDTISERVIQVCCQSSSKGWNETALVIGQLLFIQDVIRNNDNPAILTADVFSLIKILIPQSTISTSPPPSHINDVTREIAVKHANVYLPATKFEPNLVRTNVPELWSKMMTVSVDDEKYSNLKALPCVLPNLDKHSQINNLVYFEGIIFNVDEANAFSWLTCNECGSDDFTEFPDTSFYICNSCGLDIHSPITNTHLEVYLKSVNKPSLFVKAKLLQSTISRLLPVCEAGADELSQGYDVQCVLQKHLGPMSWYILKKYDENSEEDQKISFKLEEIDTSHWS